MASVSGSKLAFFVPGLTGDKVNVVLTSAGSSLSGPTVAGSFNIEVFTGTAGALGAGFQGSAFVQGAVQLTNNLIQAATLSSTEQLLVGNYLVIDQTGKESIQIVGSSGGSSTVIGSAGDTISGSTISGNSQLIDISGTNASVTKGPATAIGGAGNSTVWAATGDAFTGGSGAATITGNAGNNMKITGGSGSLTVFNLGSANSVTGSSSGFTFVDDNYGGSGNTITGGGGTGPGTDPSGGTFTQGTEIIAAKGDVIIGGSGTMLVNAQKSTGGTSVSGGGGAATVWGGTAGTVTGGSGTLQFNDGTGTSVTGGAGKLYAYQLGSGNTVTGGSSGTDFIDDSYAGGGNNRLVGGSAATRIIGGSGDTIVGGTGALSAEIKLGFGSETVNLSAAASADGVRDVNTIGGGSSGTGGTAATVTGFDFGADVIQSAQSVTAGGVFTGSSSSSAAGTTLTFVDGNTMFIAGVTNVAFIKFTQ